MSIDQEFFPVTFPALRSLETDPFEVQSRASGHAAGYAAGLRAASGELAERIARLDAEHEAAVLHGRARIDRVIAVLGAAARALDERTLPLIEGSQDALAAAAIELAEAILGSELSRDENSARSALTRALAGADSTTVRVVRMNPVDLAGLDADTIAATGVLFAPDDSLARGDAVTEFEVGYLDARISTALARAKAAIAGEAS
ncbi:FliH/SctL family protein [Lacisediminihabitans profunda]|uniref:Flagellar assembly protein FliH/Type III secretion system HrpE domain-containing protein n=1 Tax=Lacisediminihabitans profunda TaxID=2594790 RepID=A0A5C8UMS0_9MICO|nr:FliH/SctL family protein [Lacisediminihabitans profunda]TXN29211.1 hypothetical protein FVP33_13590 [Lacisediminihabitans profunda]